MVTIDGQNLVSHAGLGLLAEMADRSGLTTAMSEAMRGCGISWHTHDPGVVLTHLVVAIADGADCLSDLAVLREQHELFGPVASQATAWRTVEAVAAVELRRINTAVATARARVWDTAGISLDSLTIDFDATLVTSHSDKQDAAPTYKRGFGFHPFGVWADETREPLAMMLRPGNAGANDAADHIQLLTEAIDSLPARWQAGHRCFADPTDVAVPILARADSAGASHDFVDELVSRNIGYSLGFAIDARVRDGLLYAQEEHWEPARNLDGTRRDSGYVIELTECGRVRQLG